MPSPSPPVLWLVNVRERKSRQKKKNRTNFNINSVFLWFSPYFCWYQQKYFMDSHFQGQFYWNQVFLASSKSLYPLQVGKLWRKRNFVWINIIFLSYFRHFADLWKKTNSKDHKKYIYKIQQTLNLIRTIFEATRACTKKLSTV